MGRLADAARADGRDYATPEDVQDVIDAGVDKLELWGELLASVGKQTGLGLEDGSACCFVAHRFRRSPVVFIDFDGVINSADWWQRRSPRPKPANLESDARWSFDPDAVQRLNRLAAAGARFVISSTWRCSGPLDELVAMLRSAGFEGKVIGATPDMSVREPGRRFHRAVERGTEIQAWLDANGSPPFVILDDDDDMGPLRDRLVQTDDRFGLLDEHVEQALALLGRRG